MSNRTNIRKIVLPVAGLGTRFLPVTKAVPKELLPVVDRPLIQYAIDEAHEAGIEQLIFVNSPGKEAIQDYLEPDATLEAQLRAKGNATELERLAAILPNSMRVSFALQKEPLGLGHAVWCARDLVGSEPFAVTLPDDLVHSTPGCLKQMIDAYAEVGGNLVAIEEVPRNDTQKWGVIDPGQEDGHLTEVRGLVEKPKPEEAPSTLAIIGRYILQPEIFDALSRQKPGAGNEIQLTDAMSKLIGHGPFHGYRFNGTRYDCGSKNGFLSANIAYALDRDDLTDELRAFLSNLSVV